MRTPLPEDITPFASIEELDAALAKAEDAYDLIHFQGCPCFSLVAPGFRAEGRCWRVGNGRCFVEVRGSRDRGERLRALLDRIDWYGSWDLVMEAA